MKTKQRKRVRVLAVMLSLAMIQISLLTIIMPPIVSHAEELAAEAEYEAKKAAYREQIKSNDVTTDDLLIGSWVSFYSFGKDSWEYQLDQMVEAGLNYNMFPKHFGGGSAEDIQYWIQVEQEYSKRNMVYNMNAPNSMTYDTAASLAAMAAQGMEHCVGYHVTDEPTYAKLDEAGAAVRDYRSLDNTRYPFVNLLPSYAGKSALGGSYRQYLDRFVEEAGADNIEYLSHDYYPFSDSGKGGTISIFNDMEDMRAVAYENGKMKTHGFIQATAWNGMRMPNIDEMRWQAYAYLTYGFKGLSYFNLVCAGYSDTAGEGFYDAIIYRDGTIRDPELFADFTELNWELRGLSDALMNLDAAAVYHTNGDVQYVPADFLLTPVPRSNADMAVSYMEAKDGSESYIMLFNKSFTDEVTAKFCVDMSAGIEAIEYLDPLTGEYIEMDISDGHLEDSFRKGEGKLYRLKGTATWATEPSSPSVDLKSGYYTGAQTITVSSANPNDKLYYTLDGTYPTANATKYTVPITLGENGQSGYYNFCVAAVRDGKVSQVVSQQYVIDCLSTKAPGVKLLSQLDSSSVNSIGQWTTSEKAVVLSGGATSNYLNAYVDKSETFASFTATGTFLISQDSADSAAAGFVLKGETDDSYIFMGVTAKGKLSVICNGETIDVVSNNKQPIDVSKAFALRVFRAGSYLKISVTGGSGVHTVEGIYPEFDANVGYLGVNGTKGAMFTAQNVYYNQVEGAYGELQETIVRLNGRDEITIPYGASKEAVIKALIKNVRGYLRNGDYENLALEWNLDDFDTTNSGHHTLKGYPVMPEGSLLVNANNLAVNALVHVLFSPDYTELDKILALVASLVESNYSPETWEKILQPYEIAQGMKNGKFSQDEVDAVVAELQSVLNELVPVSIDFSSLDAMLNTLEKIDLDTLTIDSRTVIEQAIESGKAFSRTGPITQADVDAMVAVLRQAEIGMIPIGNPSALLALIAEYEKCDLTGMTEESVNAFNQAMAKAKRVAADRVTQADIDLAEKELRDVYAALTAIAPDTNAAGNSGGCQSTVTGVLAWVCCMTVAFVALKKSKVVREV